VKSFREFFNEAYTPGTVLNFGATAYGNADIDRTTALDIKKGDIRPEWQFLGNKNNRLTPGYSVANNVLPHGTIVKITDKTTNQPVGVPFGNVNGIYKVEDTGGKQVSRNIDFYSGSNKEMMNYYAKYGTNSGKLNVEILNIKPGSPEEQQILANLNKPQQSQDATGGQEQSGVVYNTLSDALGGLESGIGMMNRITGGGVK